MLVSIYWLQSVEREPSNLTPYRLTCREYLKPKPDGTLVFKRTELVWSCWMNHERMYFSIMWEDAQQWSDPKFPLARLDKRVPHLSLTRIAHAVQ